jgi:SAM-dependent methyltransferase
MIRAVTTQSSELQRIRAAYRDRDAAPGAAYSWTEPGYRFYMQELEWALLRDLGRVGVSLGGADVLEVGCGSGYFLHRMYEYGAARAVGIDLMEERIEGARQRYPALEFVAGDAAALAWDDASFDVVTQYTCLSSVLDPSLRRAIAAEMWRVTRPGGAVVSYDMRRTPAPIRALGRLHARRYGDGVPHTPTTPIELEELRAIFPGGELTHRIVSLNVDIGRQAARGRLLATAASALPFLRTHLLAIVRKPA